MPLKVAAAIPVGHAKAGVPNARGNAGIGHIWGSLNTLVITLRNKEKLKIFTSISKH